MANYLERQDILDAISSSVEFTKDGELLAATKILNIIKGMPTADVKPVVHGKWYWAEDRHCKCSVCGQYATVKRIVVKTNYCPNCGADMRGE